MRLRLDSLLVLILLTTVCLIVGVVVGILTGNVVIATPRASPTAPRTTPISVAPRGSPPTAAPTLQLTPRAGQMGLLIVGVSDANELLPKFEGCWIVAFTPGINQYYVLSFPPDARFQVTSTSPDRTLADFYADDVGQEVGYHFVRDAIQSVFPAMAVQAEVTLDRSDLADLTFKLGGIPIGSQMLLGPGLTAAYDSQSFNGAAARTDFQRQAFRALFHALASQHWSPASVAVYLEQLPHAVRPEDAATLNVLANSAPALQSSELTWTVVGGVH